MKRTFTKITLGCALLLSTSNAWAISQSEKASLKKAFETGDSFILESVKKQIVSRGSSSDADFANMYIRSLELEKQKAQLAQKAKDNKRVTGKIEGGASFESGNNERESLNVDAELKYKLGNWENILTGLAVSAEESGNRTAEEYRIANQSRYNITDYDYAFVELSFVNDRFSGFKYRTDELVGYGRRLINKEDMKLNTEISVGARQSKLTTGEELASALGKVRGDFVWNINDALTFEQDLSVTVDKDVTIINSDTGFKAQMTDALYLRLGFQFENISDVPVGVESTDTRTTISVGYNF